MADRGGRGRGLSSGWVVRARTAALLSAASPRREQRQQDLVVPGQGETTLSGATGGSFDHVDPGPVVLDLIEIHGGQVGEIGAQVAGHRQRLGEPGISTAEP
jgi:hypothetical protein